MDEVKCFEASKVTWRSFVLPQASLVSLTNDTSKFGDKGPLGQAHSEPIARIVWAGEQALKL